MRLPEEWAQAQAQIANLLHAADGAQAGSVVALHLGRALHATAPRPGILTAAAQVGIPVFVTGDAGLAEVGVTSFQASADDANLAHALAGATLIAFGTGCATVSAVAPGACAAIIALGSAPFPGASLSSATDAGLALPLLATGLAQRIPTRARPTPSDAAPTDEPRLMPVG